MLRISGSRPASAILIGFGLAAMTLSMQAWSGGSGDHGHAKKEEHMDMHDSASHAHDKWVDPPASYAMHRNHNWNDANSATRGKAVYDRNCAICHGADGTGNGTAAGTLDHKPADLTNHFHRGPGLGDAYLFWRISEGGMVEPFKSQKSAMPAFKQSLNEADRWDVLTYVHQLFHGKFKGVHDDQGMGHDDQGMGHDDQGMSHDDQGMSHN